MTSERRGGAVPAAGDGAAVCAGAAAGGGRGGSGAGPAPRLVPGAGGAGRAEAAGRSSWRGWTGWSGSTTTCGRRWTWCVEAVESDQWLVDSPTTAEANTNSSSSEPTTDHPPLATAVEAGLRLAGALTWFWIKGGHRLQGWQSMSRLLAAGSGARAAARGKALVGAMVIARYRFDDVAIADLAAEGLALGREAGDRWLTAASLFSSAIAAKNRGDLERAEGLGEDARGLARELGDGWLLNNSVEVLAYVARMRSDYGRARTLHQEALARCRELGDTGGMAAQASRPGMGGVCGGQRRGGEGALVRSAGTAARTARPPLARVSLGADGARRSGAGPRRPRHRASVLGGVSSDRQGAERSALDSQSPPRPGACGAGAGGA